MDPKFFRKYADIITEAEQLDEGMLDSLKSKALDLFSKAKQVPGFAEGVAKAKAMSAQLKQILASSKSGAEVGEKIKALAQGGQVAEGDAQIVAGSAGVLGGAALSIWEASSGLLDAVFASGSAPHILWLAGMPILIVMMGLALAMTAEPTPGQNMR